jgi:antitoxin component YwqK of YwqJK toxin-antitoxin module
MKTGMPNKSLFILLLLLGLTQANAQKIEKFFDYKWKECEPSVARFYSLTNKTDSGYLQKNYYIRERKLQMYGNYEDSLFKVKNGEFHYYHPNGIPQSVGKYIHDKKEGLWLSYHANGMMSDSTVFLHDKKIGTSLSWYPNGYKSDSTYSNVNESGIAVSWFDTGSPSSAGRYSAGNKQDGTWKYFHKNGRISSIETYHQATLLSKQYFDENGMLQNDTTNRDKMAEFPGGVEALLKYVTDNLYFPDGYKIIHADIAKVVVQFTINEDGTVEDVFTSVAFDKRFDSIAESVIKKSPQWSPAIDHNRKVKCRFTLPVTFQNYKE